VINVWSNGRDTFSTPNTVAKFAVICVMLATPISATVGITTLVIAGYAEWANFANIWLTWWLGDMIGALVVTPVVVLCALSDARAFRRTELTKSAAVISLAVAVGFIAFNPLFKQAQHPDTFGFLAVLPLLWAALHRGPRDTAIASFILAGFSIWGTFSAAGPFAPASLNDAFLSVLVFLISVSVPSLALSADVAMRKTIEENMRRTHTELDRRVEMRTAEVAAANQALRDEVSRRAGTEKEALEQQRATSEVLQVISSGICISARETHFASLRCTARHPRMPRLAKTIHLFDRPRTRPLVVLPSRNSWPTSPTSRQRGPTSSGIHFWFVAST
jgi:hypothetical protein